MKKKSISLLAAISAAVLLALYSFTAYADGRLLVDRAGLLISYEYEDVLDELERISEAYGCSTVIITDDDVLIGEDIEAYTEELYANGGYANDGIMLFVDIGTRDYYILSRGIYDVYGKSDASLAYIEDAIIDDLSDNEFYDAFIAFAQACEEVYEYQSGTGYFHDEYEQFVQEYESTYESVYNDEPVPANFNWFSKIPIALVIGLVIAFIIVCVMKGQLKSVKKQDKANNYIKNGSMNVTESKDIFLYHHISRTPRPKNNSSGSSRPGGGMHSGGARSSGRGGKF